ncbi:TPA: tyrosine-type recombinase/integrase [Mannheimia haemolytica]
MAVRKDESRGKWITEAYVNGKRIRKWFSSKAEATRFFNQLKIDNSPLAQAVVVRREQPQRLSELCKLWYELHGKSLVSGAASYDKLKWMCKVFGDPYARDFTASDFAEYRAKRLSGEIVNDLSGIVPKETYINREQAILRSVFAELERLGKWSGGNPLAKIRAFKVKEQNLAFLRSDEIDRLLDVCDKSRNKYLGIIVRICLATGARWGEAQDLTSSQLIPYKITYAGTKNGKNRTIPISQELYDLIPKTSGKVFAGTYYKACHRAFKLALKKADITLPMGQATHVLRHTFASHFMMNGGNILVLRDILGHSDIKMTMRYAHFAPAHLEQAITLNPLVNR